MFEGFEFHWGLAVGAWSFRPRLAAAATAATAGFRRNSIGFAPGDDSRIVRPL